MVSRLLLLKIGRQVQGVECGLRPGNIGAGQRCPLMAGALLNLIPDCVQLLLVTACAAIPTDFSVVVAF